ncbi:hypothetical protein C6341_g7219 [Phytophthora cactorum]|nr:hypothetical protein C6341_g7219 [Phytophthora cactorum]
MQFRISEQVLAPRFIGPFTVLERHGNAYTLDIPSSMRLHPTFYVGRLKPYTQHEPPNLDGSQRTTKRRKPASRGRQHGRGASGPAFQVPLGCSTRPARSTPSVEQLLLQLGELPTLELFQSGYTIVQSAGVTVKLGLTVRGVCFRPAATTARCVRLDSVDSRANHGLLTPEDEPRSGSSSYSLERISSPPRYMGTSERSDGGRSGNGEGVRSPERSAGVTPARALRSPLTLGVSRHSSRRSS